MGPRDFLRVADELARTDSPAHNRTAVSRAYYAVYNVACDMMQALGFDVERGHAGHEAIRERLLHSGVDRLISVGAGLRRLHQNRVRADYSMQGPHPERRTTVERWLAQATRMIADLDAILAEPSAQQRIIRSATAERAVPMVGATAALVLADHALRRRGLPQS